MTSFRELAARVRLANCALSLLWARWHFERSQRNLERALQAFEDARADAFVHAYLAAEPPAAPPAWLMRGKP